MTSTMSLVTKLASVPFALPTAKIHLSPIQYHDYLIKLNGFMQYFCNQGQLIIF